MTASQFLKIFKDYRPWPSVSQLACCNYLERRGLKFLVDFGFENAKDIAWEELEREQSGCWERFTRRMKRWRQKRDDRRPRSSDEVGEGRSSPTVRWRNSQASCETGDRPRRDRGQAFLQLDQSYGPRVPERAALRVSRNKSPHGTISDGTI